MNISLLEVFDIHSSLADVFSILEPFPHDILKLLLRHFLEILLESLLTQILQRVSEWIVSCSKEEDKLRIQYSLLIILWHFVTIIFQFPQVFDNIVHCL